MQILPPRRPGNFGAFTAGPGSPGPTGQFSIQMGAAPSREPSPRDLPAAKGSIAKPPPLSVSEQLEAQRKAAAKTAAEKTVPPGQADVYGRPAQVFVQSYAPPKNTPAVTQPPAQPNASLDVKAQAGQVPQTPQQVIQKTLAKDAGIATSLPAGQPPLRMPPATPQVSKLTTNPGADRIALNPQVSPPVSPRSFKDAAKAATATVGAKIATQRASDAAITAATLVRRSMDTKAATVAAIDLSKSAEATAKAKAEEFNQTRIAASRVLGSQTASPDEKAQAEASVRTAAEAKALAEREAAAAKAKADAAAKAKAELDALASRAAAEAEVAKAKADEQAKQAIEAQKKLVSAETAVAEQPKMLPPPSGAPAVSGEAPAAAPAEKPTVITGEGQAATAAPEAAVVEKPAAGSKVMPILALGAVALLAYAAMRKKGPSLNAAPTLIEDLD